MYNTSMDGNDGHSLGEDALARAWAALGQEEALYTRQGELLQVLFPGVRNAGAGPDFARAVLRTERGRVVRGDVELHRETQGWRRHGHHRDPRYRGVVLHVVQDGRAGSATALPHGGRAPVLVLPSRLAPEAALARCAECRTAALDPEALRPLLARLGRLRFGRKARFWKRRLARLDPAAQDAALFGALIEGLGYGARRPAFRALAAAVSWSELRAAVVRGGPAAALALLLGTAGFLEDRDGPAMAGVERDALRARWSALRRAPTLAADAWPAEGRRPAAQPWLRLMGAAGWAARWTEGPLVALAAARSGAKPAAALRAALAVTAEEMGVPAHLTPVGGGCADRLTVNVALPFLFGRAQEPGADAALAQTEALFAAHRGLEPDGVVRRLAEALGLAGGRLRASEQQGLHHLHRYYCQRGRQGSCPVAGEGLLKNEG